MGESKKSVFMAYCGYSTRPGNEGKKIEVPVQDCQGKDPKHCAALVLIQQLGGTFRVTQRRIGLFKKQNEYSVIWDDPERQVDASPIVLGAVEGIAEEHQAALNLLEQVGWILEPVKE